MVNPNLFFSTPVWTSRIDSYNEINQEILVYIKNLQKNDNEGVIKSNVNGWHSKNFNMRDDIPKKFVSIILPYIKKTIDDMGWDMEKQTIRISNMWAIINKGGASNSRHHHGNSALSAAYYVKAPKNSGDIVFYDPRPAPVYSHPSSKKPNSLNAMVNSISPFEGGLILFPSYLDHSVNENISNEERIVISFNIIISPK